MMKWFFCVIIVMSVVAGILNENISEVSNSIIQGGVQAVELFLILIGSMGLWGGIMRIAQKSCLTDKINRVLSPIVKLLFKGIDVKGKAFTAISLNITANLMGLGNASTPLGLEAMKELEKEEGKSEFASRNMILLVILNTASIQLIPTTIATLRLQYGSSEPMAILPSVLLTSLTSLIVAIVLVFTLDTINKGVKKSEVK